MCASMIQAQVRGMLVRTRMLRLIHVHDQAATTLQLAWLAYRDRQAAAAEQAAASRAGKSRVGRTRRRSSMVGSKKLSLATPRTVAGAARLVQRGFRRWRFFRAVRAAIVIQRHWRGHAARLRVAVMRQQRLANAAVMLQKWFRGYRERRALGIGRASRHASAVGAAMSRRASRTHRALSLHGGAIDPAVLAEAVAAVEAEGDSHEPTTGVKRVSVMGQIIVLKPRRKVRSMEKYEDYVSSDEEEDAADGDAAVSGGSSIVSAAAAAAADDGADDTGEEKDATPTPSTSSLLVPPPAGGDEQEDDGEDSDSSVEVEPKSEADARSSLKFGPKRAGSLRFARLAKMVEEAKQDASDSCFSAKSAEEVFSTSSGLGFRRQFTEVLPGLVKLEPSKGAKIAEPSSMSKGEEWTLAFWIYPTEQERRGFGPWRTLLIKGSDFDKQRMPGVFLHRRNFRLGVCVTTADDWNNTMVPASFLQAYRWQHVCIQCRRHQLQIFLNGVPDSRVEFDGPVLHNDFPFYLNKPPPGVKHAVHDYPGVGGYVQGMSFFYRSLQSSEIAELAQPPAADDVRFDLMHALCIGEGSRWIPAESARRSLRQRKQQASLGHTLLQRRRYVKSLGLPSQVEGRILSTMVEYFRSPDDEAAVLNYALLLHVFCHDYYHARILYRRLLRARPNAPLLLYLAAIVEFVSLGNPRDALWLMLRADKLDPLHSRFRLRHIFQKPLAWAPEQPQVLLNLAFMHAVTRWDFASADAALGLLTRMEESGSAAEAKRSYDRLFKQRQFIPAFLTFALEESDRREALRSLTRLDPIMPLLPGNAPNFGDVMALQEMGQSADAKRKAPISKMRRRTMYYAKGRMHGIDKRGKLGGGRRRSRGRKSGRGRRRKRGSSRVSVASMDGSVRSAESTAKL
eukprot:PLAT6403.4.p1 GENE.PLAT6403.4~~PLAT6403.4.p1  ORF type:complete len:1003 (-),score=451.79 PLAT6403.4:39-2759(-)